MGSTESAEPSTASRAKGLRILVPPAWVWLVIAYLLVYAFGVVISVYLLVTDTSDSGEASAETADDIAASAILTALGVLAAGYAIYRSKHVDLQPSAIWRDMVRRPWWWRVTASAGVYGLASVLSNKLVTCLQGDHTAAAAGSGYSGSVGQAVARALTAGIGEEIIVVAAVVIVLEGYGKSWKWIIPLSVAARIAYHLYYGWGAAGMIIWAAAAVWVYWRWRTVVPLILWHTWSDISAFWPNRSDASWWLTSSAQLTVATGLTAVALAYVAWTRIHAPRAGEYGPMARPPALRPD